MKFITTTKGYSLVEVLVAVAILMLSIVGPLTIAAKSLQGAQYVRQQNTAFFLAQEGISAVNTIRNNAGLAHYSDNAVSAWSWTTDSNLISAKCFDTSIGCNMDFNKNKTLEETAESCATAANCTLKFDESAGRSVYQLESGDTTPFLRVITLKAIGADEVLVTSKVEWNSTLLGAPKTVTLSTSLFNLYK